MRNENAWIFPRDFVRRERMGITGSDGSLEQERTNREDVREKDEFRGI